MVFFQIALGYHLILNMGKIASSLSCYLVILLMTSFDVSLLS